MRMYDIIAKKRDGLELNHSEMEFFIKGCTSGDIPDYQTAALLMAIYLNGMSDAELLDMTLAMRDSGRIADFSGIEGHTVDKHSTGGVGDKTTMIVVPMAAALGCKIVKMSGRGLGHTGGTVDKLESVPGFRTALTHEEIVRSVNEIGACMIGHSDDLAPADKKLYYLRDVTATVSSLPLIASSIMSKKLACGSDCILLDVKFGSGALMSDMSEAVSLASEMVKIGKSAGKRTAAVLTNMDVPLGYAVGNSLEVEEAVRILRGEQKGDLYEISIELTAHMAHLASGLPMTECRRLSVEVIDNGTAFEKLKEIIAAQGGDTTVIDDTSLLPKARFSCDIKAEATGYIAHMNTQKIGEISMILGAGRAVKEDVIDHAAGILLRKKTGDAVTQGDVIATLYTNDSEKILESVMAYESVVTYSEVPPEVPPLIYDVIK